MNEPSKNELIYLASLYSLGTKDIRDPLRELRYQRVKEVSAAMMRDGWVILSPIVHCHCVSLDHGLPGEWGFWKHIDTIYISKCDRLMVLEDENWTQSVGINAEIKIAESFGKPVSYVTYQNGIYKISCTAANS